jgi:hypothetical protein
VSSETEHPSGDQPRRFADEPDEGAAGAAGERVEAPASTPSRAPAGRETAPNMLPGRQRRRLGAERVLTRLIATGGIIGIGVALGAILASSNVQGWIIGLVVSGVSVILSAVLWSSRQL